MCRAAHAAHQQQLIHRDIKPGNVLIERPEGEAGLEHVYLADFGLTKHALSRSGITQTGEFLGTIDYVAPEQIAGRRVDARTDVYSLGCLVYEMLTGEVPFPREADVAILWAHMQDPAPSVRRLRPDVPEGIDDTIRRAIAKQPEDRYVSALELIAALIDVVRNAPAAPIVPAFAPTQPEGSASPPPPRVEPAQPDAAADEVVTAPATVAPGRSRRPLVLAGIAVALIGAVVAAVLLLRGSSSSTEAKGSAAHTTTTGASASGVQSAVPPQIWSQLDCQPDPQAVPPGIPGKTLVVPAGTVMSSATCSSSLQGEVPVELHLALFDSTADMNDVYNRNLRASPVTAGSGPCGPNTFEDEGVWRHGGTHGVVAGRKFCFFSTNPQRAVIAWTLTMTMESGMGNRYMLAIANAPAANHELLLKWWRQYRHQIGEGS